MNSNLYEQCPSAKLWRQFAAMFYDSLLITAILFVATAIALIFSGGEAIETNHFYNLFLLLLIFIFYSWFWTRSGQTLGMRVWKIRIVSDLGGNPTWAACFLRLIFAMISIICLGIGYWWRLLKPYTWHDHLSQTRIVDISALPKDQQ